jgi:hypothetical protein
VAVAPVPNSPSSESGGELSTEFAAYSSLPSRIGMMLVPNLPRTGILAGLFPYFAFSVLYDAEHSVIGLKRR